MNTNSRKVVVLGAGPAGLAAAHVLAKRGVAVEVLERNNYVGGLCVTLNVNGFRFDLGGHRWFTKNEELHRWFVELMAGELVTVKRTSRIYFQGKYFDYPISIRNVLDNVGLLKSAHAGVAYLVAAAALLIASRPPRNMKEAYCAQFGEQLYEMFFRRYSEKVWGQRCEEMSADWVSQRSKGLSILTALGDALLKRKDVVSLIDEFLYPRDGYQRICIRMAEDIERMGGGIRLCAPVTSVSYLGPQRFTVHCADGTAVPATDVISTVPLPLLARMMAPACPAAISATARSLRFRDLITVTVMLRRPQVTSDTWLYVHDDDVVFARIHEPRNWSEALVPGPGFTSVVCECFCTEGDAVWALDDKALAQRVVSDLASKLGFILPEEVLDTCVVRTRDAYPIYDLDYQAKVTQLYQFVNQHPGLHIVGRGGTFRYNNADHSIEMGQLVAKTLLGAATDHMSVNTERAYHEEIRRARVGAGRG